MLSSVLAGSILLIATIRFSAFHSWPFGFPLFEEIWKRYYNMRRFWPERIEESGLPFSTSVGFKFKKAVRLSPAATAHWLLPALLGLAGILKVAQVFYSPLLSFLSPIDEYLQGNRTLLLLACLLLITWAGSFLVRYVYGRPPNERTLIKVGPYKYVRHPVYLSFVLFGVGTLVVSLNLLKLITLAYLVCMAHKYQSEEDLELTNEYGKEYDEYKRSTGAFFPKISARETRPGLT